MMRSLFSAVSGLKTHQTKMDVIGNNVANVNTVAFKSSTTTFSELMYQTISNASGANAATGKGGVNAKQIGLGVTMGATKITINSSGAAETTGDPFDIRLTDANSTNFFVVSTGTENLFTRAGSFYVDGAGNLCMTSTGYTVMGWQVDEATGDIKKDTVSALQIMSEKNMTSAPEATTMATVAGVMDKNDSNIGGDDGYAMNLNFFDKLGYSYTAKFAVKLEDADTETYTVELTDILDSENKSVLNQYLSTGGTTSDVFGKDTTAKKTYPIAEEGIYYTSTGIGQSVPAGSYYYSFQNYTPGTGIEFTDYAIVTPNFQQNTYTIAQHTVYETAQDAVDGVAKTVPEQTGEVTELFGITRSQLGAYGATGDVTGSINTTTGAYVYQEPAVNYTLKFNADDGTFSYIGAEGADTVTLNLSDTLGGNFEDIEIDFSTCKAADNAGKTTLGADPGIENGSIGKGKALGAMTGITINNNGKIYGSYDNGNTVLLGQIAVAQFANASGLEKVGENCYTTTLNSGDFDGIGVEIAADGSSMTTGELEMSNVDLSTEFTQMIITQRGFQSNSRVITTSDTLLEELINLKR
ncbi:MAG: flagellar hook-basal body complex protein [Lachnospiraceae bacterium]|nr:flagellar hook-basal body complex protein [Lachnospiraceae bacterium]